MNDYNDILVAVDLSRDSQAVIAKARHLASYYDAQLSMIHVVEPISISYSIEVASLDLEGLQLEAAQHSKQNLQSLGSKIGIPSERLHILMGHPAGEIKQLAKNIHADLIVMGSHGRRGWELLFGSTSTSVTHGLECDLLTVHV